MVVAVILAEMVVITDTISTAVVLVAEVMSVAVIVLLSL